MFGETTGKGQLGNLHRFPGSEVAFGDFIEGWLDITHPKAPFAKLAFDNSGSKEDFLNMRLRVTRVLEAFARDRDRAKAMQAPP
jgi:hypothetical protein